jgi:uncharacterized repeat protein (TIGR03803 family)
MERHGCVSRRLWFVAGLLGSVAISRAPAIAGTYTQLYGFTGGADGATPLSGVTPDSHGNVYGTTQAGGDLCKEDPYSGCGIVYQLDSTGKLTVVHTFAGGDGGSEPVTGVMLADGKIFGSAGGGSQADGMLYSMDLDGSDYTSLHQFAGKDGAYPAGLLRLTASGIYGITSSGGAGYTTPSTGNGVLFVVGLDGRFAVRHYFQGGTDGRVPNQIVVDALGNVFGSTSGGGGGCPAGSSCGSIFEYSPSSDSYSIIYRFQKLSDGYGPALGAIDSSGTLYGVASGGEYKHGTLFSLSPQNGTYTFNLLTSFTSHEPFDGPSNPPSLSSDGAIVGATDTYLYAYHHGTLSTVTTNDAHGVPYIEPGGPFYVGRGSVVYGTSLTGGITPCVSASGDKDPNGCGTIFAYAPY